MFEKVKRFYEKGLYSKAIVAEFVKKGALSHDDYFRITGEEFL